MTEKTDNRSV